MAGLLHGAGGASCHLCTARNLQIYSVDWVNASFPINRFILDVHKLFNEINEEFLKLSSQQHAGITYQLRTTLT